MLGGSSDDFGRIRFPLGPGDRRLAVFPKFRNTS